MQSTNTKLFIWATDQQFYHFYVAQNMEYLKLTFCTRWLHPFFYFLKLVNIIFDIVLTGSVELGSQKSPLRGTDELLHA
jgi:hypothetical protein